MIINQNLSSKYSLLFFHFSETKFFLYKNKKKLNDKLDKCL